MELMLAPMAGYTDKVYRGIAVDMGCNSTITEMVSAKALFYNDKKTLELMELNNKEKNAQIQLFGNDPKVFSGIVDKIPKNFKFININMGCPAPKIVKNGSGSALLDSPDLCADIVRAIKSETDTPVSIKIRKGIFNKNQGIEVAKKCEKAGASMIIVHGRTREEYYSGNNDWDFIKNLKESVSIDVIGNGDIKNYEDAKRAVEFSGVDGLAIGRGAIGNPFIFKEINYRERNLYYEEPSLEEKMNMFLNHLRLLIEYKGQRIGIREMRKQFVGYSFGLRDSKNMRNQLNKLDEYEEVEKLIKEYVSKYADSLTLQGFFNIIG